MKNSCSIFLTNFIYWRRVVWIFSAISFFTCQATASTKYDSHSGGGGGNSMLRMAVPKIPPHVTNGEVLLGLQEEVGQIMEILNRDARRRKRSPTELTGGGENGQIDGGTSMPDGNSSVAGGNSVPGGTQTVHSQPFDNDPAVVARKIAIEAQAMYYEQHKKEFDDKITAGDVFLPDGYSRYEVPIVTLLTANGTVVLPVPSKIMLNIRSVLAIDEENERIMCDFDFLIGWLDGKIFKQEFANFVDNPHTLKAMPPIFGDKIWKPDIYLDNLVQLQKLAFMEPPLSIEFAELTGVITYRERLVPVMKCGMEFAYYPADTQICEFSFRSYSYGINDLKVLWAGPVGLYLSDPTDANFDLRVGDMEELTVPEEVNYGTNKSYFAVRFKLRARRKLSYHIIQTYIPSVFFVVITWLCFLLPPTMVEARIGITMTTLLTLTAMFSSVRESTPNVSYAKAIDIWMLICILFIFFTLLEFAVMVWVQHQRDRKNKPGPGSGADEDFLREIDETVKQSSNPARLRKVLAIGSVTSLQLKKYEKAAKSMEKYAFFFYATAFLAFTISYWAWLLVSANYFDWEVDPLHNNI